MNMMIMIVDYNDHEDECMCDVMMDDDDDDDDET